MRVVAFVQEPLNNAGSRCRVAALVPGLRERGIELTVLPPASEKFAAWSRSGGPHRRLLYYLRVFSGRIFNLPRAMSADAVIVFRSMFSVGPPLLEIITAKLNRRFVFEFDDAMHLRPPFASGGYRFVDLQGPAKILRRSRAAVVGSPWLEELALRHCRDVRVIPSCLNTDALPVREAENDPLVVGWMGTKGGFLYLRELAPVLIDLQREHDFVLRVVSNGQLEIDGLSIENIPWSLEREAELLRSFDIGIMPLANTPFESGKAGFKLLQYLAVGSAAVASPTGVNRDICGPDEERALIARSPEEWREKLGLLLRDGEKRKSLAASGPDFVREHYDLRNAVEAWETLLRDITR